MGRRGWLAIAVLAIWGVTLGWHVKRLYFKPLGVMLAEAARTIPPGVAYYAVFRGDDRIGWAQTEVDTLPSASGFAVRDRLILEQPILPGLDPLRFQVDARLGPSLSLESFRLEATGAPEIRQASGEVHGDSILDLQVEGESGTRRERVPLDGPLVLSAAWPLRFAAQGGSEVGEATRLPVFDPLTGASRMIEYRVLGQETRTYPDSATIEDGRWVEARRDTVEAWWVEQDLGGIRLRAWVDEDGRLLAAEMPGGLRIERTAFELAYPGSGGRRGVNGDDDGKGSE